MAAQKGPLCRKHLYHRLMELLDLPGWMLFNYFIINPSYSQEHDNQGVPVAMDVGAEVIYTTRNINEEIIPLIFKNKLPLWHIVHKMRLCLEMFKTNTQINEPFLQVWGKTCWDTIFCAQRANDQSYALKLIGAISREGWVRNSSLWHNLCSGFGW